MNQGLLDQISGLQEKARNLAKRREEAGIIDVDESDLSRLPSWPEQVRALPNALARSALFSSCNRSDKRREYKKQPIASVGNVVIYYTGTELRQDDEDVFLQVVHISRKAPLGEIVEFSAYSMFKELGWESGARSYRRLRECIDRMTATSITISFKNGQKGYGGSLFRKFAWDDKGVTHSKRWKIWLEKEIVVLFSPDMYTHLEWEQRLSLPPLAKWLHQFYSTHRDPIGYKVETIHKLCGSRIQVLAKFRYRLREALGKLQEAGFLEQWEIDRRTDLLQIKRAPRKGEFFLQQQ